jgi:glucose-6-phosphate 1-dehydrogenase
MVVGDSSDPKTYQALAKCLETSTRPVFYLAIPPSVFADAQTDTACYATGFINWNDYVS